MGEKYGLLFDFLAENLVVEQMACVQEIPQFNFLAAPSRART